MAKKKVKTISKMWLMVKIDGDGLDVRQVHIDDDTGAYGYGEAIELAPNERAQLQNVARSLARKLEAA